MDVGLMVEGQHGLNWENWRRMLATAERLGSRRCSVQTTSS